MVPHKHSVLLLVSLGVVLMGGCGDDSDVVRQIQSQRQARLQSETKQDHLGEVHGMLTRLIELNPEEARRQITYHLNRWADSNPIPEDDLDRDTIPVMLKTVNDLVPPEAAAEQLLGDKFVRGDVDHLRDAYLFKTIYHWLDLPPRDDILLTDWLTQQQTKIGDANVTSLRTAARLFDWTVRNVALEPALDTPSIQVAAPELPLGMVFQGPGYRQTDYQTLWRGTGDAMQRAAVFTQLCRQAGLVAALLAIQSTETGELNPWSVGVLIGEQVYLFEPSLGMFVPGPNQIGIATLAEARSDASVMRRLSIPGFFDYPFGKQDVQQNIALLNVLPVGMSGRMKHLQSRLTGDRRMTLYSDVDALGEQLDAAVGIAGVRIWSVPLLAEVYAEAIAQAAERDPILAFWYYSRWAVLESETASSEQFALARWRHLHGQFDTNENADLKGARPLYLSQRAPEFEIADLRIDVDLQKAYGVRRELGADPKLYDRQLQQAQVMMRLGKRTATYWLSLIQYDDERYDNAETWFRKRVLDETQPSPWVPAARYNLGRAIEHLGKTDEAIELYKTSGDLQEHGNRIRARLLSRSGDEGTLEP
ncbi:tetratricopeptide repeat protein [Novipirellula artificiosorum]|uniref:Uncharacterized protein n=1 Tax=Novipirellula artificiosorum TaxID=2528016 RepID=A0A5C6E0J2_9BACT|nr:tetratricopeptide repeat protein [Novipirellula artificiosorum]TWU40679.1 hypothetical protein Poly41_15140 [Novipirellula artificiosorum]